MPDVRAGNWLLWPGRFGEAIGGKVRRELVTAAGVLATVGLLAACAGGGDESTQESSAVAEASATAPVASVGQAACDAYFEAVRVRQDVGVTITPEDERMLDEALATAIAAFQDGADEEPALGQSAEELETMRTELAKPTPNTMLVSSASELVTRTCLRTLRVVPPDWLMGTSG